MAKRGPPPRFQWEQIRTDYVEGITDAEGKVNLPTFQQLAEIYRCTEKAVRNHSKRDNWPEARQFFSAKVEEARQASKANLLAGKGAEFDQKAFGIADAALSLIRAKLNKVVKKDPLTGELVITASPNEMTALANAASQFQKVGRLALGDTTDKSGVEGSVEVKAGGGISGLLASIKEQKS